MNVLRMTSWSRIALLFGFAIFASMALIACSDDGDSDGDATATETPAATGEPSTATPETPTEPLKIGFLADFSGPLAEFGPAIQTGVELAIQHINDAGGVHGMPVEFVTGDDKTDQTAAVEEARRLIEVEGVSAIVGPLASGVTIAVAESVAGPAGVIVISPSATSPAVTAANDSDFLFRSTTSDAAQGVVLAQLAEDEGIDNVGIMYLNDAYGQGLRDAFEGAYSGTATAASFEDGQASYLSELQAAAANGATTLIAIGYPTQAQVFLREALENSLFETFLFVDGTQSLDLVTALGADALEGMKGTAPGAGPETDALAAWEEAYLGEHESIPGLPFIKEAYDAVIAIALAAEAAGSNDGAAIRDQLRAIAGPDGDLQIPGAEGIAAAFDAVRAGDDIDFQGAATSLDWDDNGDVVTGYINIWQYTAGEIEVIDTVEFDLSE